jgi:hypothetical protein
MPNLFLYYDSVDCDFSPPAMGKIEAHLVKKTAAEESTYF